jgi:hypothetical protein
MEPCNNGARDDVIGARGKPSLPDSAQLETQ